MSTSNPYEAKSDAEIAESVTVDPLADVPAGTANEVLDWVGEDSERAKLALEKEQQGNKRKTLLTKLEALSE